MTRALLIDGGQSGCRAAVIDDGRTVATTSLPGLPRAGRDYGPLAGLRRDGVDVVAAGLTGYAGEIDAVAAALPAPRLLVTNDAVTAHLGALGGEPGVVVVAGTGAIALAVRADGATARADGYGSRLGDDGGGHWIGRAGLAAALRAADGRPGGSHQLLRRALDRFADARERRVSRVQREKHDTRARDAVRGGEARAPVAAGTASRAAAAARDVDPRAIVRAVYDAPDPVAVIAAFAREVADAALEGDEVARSIWEEGGRELARSAIAARDRIGIDGPVSYSGGLFAAGELLLGPFRDELGEVREPLGDALAGAARLLERPPFFLDLIHETGAS
jgi:N-acetylglucosamine kinase-like BadF-type ATPase